MNGPYEFSDGKSEYYHWVCKCGFVCERFRFEYSLPKGGWLP